METIDRLEIRSFTKGDTQVPLMADLLKVDGTIPALDGNVKMRMVRESDGATKINDASATILDAAARRVKYDWQSADVNEAGTFWAWLIHTNGAGKAETYPKGRRLKIIFHEAA